MEAYRHRHRDIISGEVLDKTIVLVGAGSIGSYCALLLAKIGFRQVTVYDFDTVAHENVGCQLFGPADIGRKKVDALKDTLATQGGDLAHWEFIAERFEHDRRAQIVVMAVDSMKSRLLIFKRTQGHIVDCRIGAEEGILFTSLAQDRHEYGNSLYSDDIVESLPCTAKNTAYIAAVAGGLMTASVKALATESPTKKMITFDLKQLLFNSGRTV